MLTDNEFNTIVERIVRETNLKMAMLDWAKTRAGWRTELDVRTDKGEEIENIVRDLIRKNSR